MRFLAEVLDSIKWEGYAVIPDMVESQKLVQLANLIENLNTAGTLRRNGGIYAIRNLLQSVPAVREIAESPPIRDLSEMVLGANCHAVRATLFDKRPEANWKVPWHQDLTIAVEQRVDVEGFGRWTEKAGVPHVQPPAELLEGMLAIRVQLDGCSEANGALRVLPGSHLHGRLTDDAIQQWRQTVAAVSCVVGRGGVVAMHPLLLHSSSASAHPLRRRVIHLELAARELPGGLRWYQGQLTTDHGHHGLLTKG
jgi:ectoine hydroxylase-related dioxygenase (phytanoyl-CoA dioxygenase family)